MQGPSGTSEVDSHGLAAPPGSECSLPPDDGHQLHQHVVPPARVLNGVGSELHFWVGSVSGGLWEASAGVGWGPDLLPSALPLEHRPACCFVAG